MTALGTFPSKLKGPSLTGQTPATRKQAAHKRYLPSHIYGLDKGFCSTTNTRRRNCEQNTDYDGDANCVLGWLCTLCARPNLKLFGSLKRTQTGTYISHALVLGLRFFAFFVCLSCPKIFHYHSGHFLSSTPSSPAWSRTSYFLGLRGQSCRGRLVLAVALVCLLAVAGSPCIDCRVISGGNPRPIISRSGRYLCSLE